MAISTLDYSNLIRCFAATVQVEITNPDGGGNTSFMGLITGDLAISTGANYETLMDVSAQESLSKKVSLLNNLTGKKFYEGDVRLVTFPQTAMSYINSDKIKFSVDALLVAVNKNDSPLNEWKKLLNLANPRFLNSDLGWRGMMQSPTNYKIAPDGSTTGTASIRYSTWFFSKNQLVTNVTFTPSKVVTPRGTPLYVHGTIQFEPYRALEQGEFAEYFRG